MGKGAAGGSGLAGAFGGAGGAFFTRAFVAAFTGFFTGAFFASLPDGPADFFFAVPLGAAFSSAGDLFKAVETVFWGGTRFFTAPVLAFAATFFLGGAVSAFFAGFFGAGEVFSVFLTAALAVFVAIFPPYVQLEHSVGIVPYFASFGYIFLKNNPLCGS